MTKRILLLVFLSLSFLFYSPSFTFAQTSSNSNENVESNTSTKEPVVNSVIGAFIAGASGMITGFGENCPPEMMGDQISLAPYIAGNCKSIDKTALLPQTGKIISTAFFKTNSMPSSSEYIADLLDNMGLPNVKSAFAQGNGYVAMTPFLTMWKTFRNLAYSLYIIMFVVVGVMIMFRTKVGGQILVTIQSAIPNLLITLILITFSYAIVGFLIDIMYFLIYFLVFLAASTGIVSDPNKLITRFMSYSAWSVIFEGRNSIVSATALAIGEALSGLGTGLLEVLGTVASLVSPAYLVVAITFAIAMLKLMFALVKSYVMLIIQTVTAPIQILMNAIPGSKAFGDWLKKTASYLVPFPVTAAMFILAAIFIGDPSKSVLLEINGKSYSDINPFGINGNHPFYKDYYSSTDWWNPGDDKGTIWLPPFTLTGSVDIVGPDIMRIIGFFIVLMTPATVKMAQDWLQVKESPYSSEAFATAQLGYNIGVQSPINLIRDIRHKQEQKDLARQQARWIREGVGGDRTQ